MYQGAILFAPGDVDLSEVYNFTSDRRYVLGQGLMSQDGRIWRYGKNGTTVAIAGNLYQSEVPGANHDTLAVLAAAVGAREVTVTNQASTVVADQWKGGYLIVEDSATLGAGRVYLIDGNDAEAAGSANYLIRLAQGIKEAWTTSTTVTLVKHPYDACIIHPSPPTAMIIGVPSADITASYYGWYQTHGLASVLIEGTVIIGKMCIPSVTTDGAVAPPLLTEATPNTGGDQPIVGRVVEVAPTTKYGAIYLTLE